MTVRAAGAVAALALLATVAAADTAVLTPTKDNTIYSNSNFVSNGAGVTIAAGRTGAGWLARSLIAFDLSAIPSGSTVTSATLALQVLRTRSGLQPFRVHRLLTNWGEGTSDTGTGSGAGATATPGDATYSYTFYNTTFWNEVGGDYLRTQFTGASILAGTLVFGPAPELTSDVQLWVDSPAQNFGWILIGNEPPGTRTAKAFGSRQNATASNRPTLTVVYDTTTPALRTTWGRIKAAYR